MRMFATLGLLLAAALALVAAIFLPATPYHPVTQSMLASAGESAGLRIDEALSIRAAGRPMVVIFIQDGCPCSEAAEPYFRRLHDAYGSRVAFVGVIDGDRAVSRDWVDRHRTPYPVLADPDLRIIRACRAERSAYVALVDPAGTIERLWPGYSAGMLAELGRRLSVLVDSPEIPIDPAGAPAKLASGCRF